jgi:N-acyl-L-homoserine lactone synthetase
MEEVPPEAAAHKVTSISFFWKRKKIGVKAVQSTFVEPINVNGIRGTRLRAIFRAPHARYYLPKDLVTAAGERTYRLDPRRAAGVDGQFIRSVIGTGFLYEDRREVDRLRIAIEDVICATIYSDERKVFSGLLADVSSKGAAILLSDDVDLNHLKSKLERLDLNIGNSLVHQKKLIRNTAAAVEFRGHRMVKLGAVFATDVKAGLPQDKNLQRENGSVRLREKTLYPTLIRALVSEATDIRFEVATDRKVMEQIYRLRYQTYLAEGKIGDSDFPDQRMTDKFDAESIHLCGRISGEVVASARIIPQERVSAFEFEESVTIPNVKQPGTRYAEVSRFCVGRFFRNDVNRGLSMTLRLIGEVCRAGWANKIDAFLITAYRPHVKLYKAIGFRPRSKYVKLSGFNFEYKVMEWDIDPQKTAPLYRKFLTGIQRETLGNV